MPSCLGGRREHEQVLNQLPTRSQQLPEECVGRDRVLSSLKKQGGTLAGRASDRVNRQLLHQVPIPFAACARCLDLCSVAYCLSSSSRALGGLLACESQPQVPARLWPRPPAHADFTLLPNCTPARPPRSDSSSTFHTTPPTALPPTNDHQIDRLPPKPAHNGPAQLILPARAVLCAYSGPLIEDQRASTHEHPLRARA